MTVRGKVGALLDDGRARVDLDRHQRRREGALPGPRDRPPGMTRGAAGRSGALPGHCSSPAARPSPTPSPPPTAPPPPRPPPATARRRRGRLPGQRAEPDPDRPVVALDFRLADDRVTVTGTETRRASPPTAPSTSSCSGWSPTAPTPRPRQPAGGRRRPRGRRRRRALRGGRRGRPGRPLRRDPRRRPGRREVHRGRTRLHPDARPARLRPLRHRRGRLLVGQRRPAARLGAGGRLGGGPVRRPRRRDREQPGHGHLGHRLRPRRTSRC